MSIMRKSTFWVGLGFSLSSFLLALSLSWFFLAKGQFLYGVWHDIGGIKEGIAEFAPKNRYKLGFAQTSRDQRVVLFTEINQSIHHHGDGLDKISYESSTSDGPQLLLREPEVVHLQDVANLIDFLSMAALVNILCWFLLLGFISKRGWNCLGFKAQLFNLMSVSTILLLILMVFGPTRVFNQLHIWIFPSDHEWFFYYQDSLMSTMMLAPTLFAWIAMSWFLISILVFIVVLLCARYMNAYLHKNYFDLNLSK